jgi:aminomethyltransferase
VSEDAAGSSGHQHGPGHAEAEAEPMSLHAEAVPQKTALHGEHTSLGARMAPFGGWDMPIDYGSIIEEHKATRTAAGLFDLSHMGEFYVTGAGAFGLVSALITNDPSTLPTGQGQYSPMCRDDGTIVDDVIVYHLPGPERARYMIVVNAANIARDWAWVTQVRAEEGLVDRTWLEDRSDEISLVAIQGPRAESILQPLTDEPLGALGSFELAEAEVAGIPASIARTGYTGEDGFEIFVENEHAPTLWTLLKERGSDAGLRAVGLGARDTLRLEARLPLYGNDISDHTTPLEAGLTRFIKLSKPHFRGKEALEKQAAEGIGRKLTGLAMEDRSVPRSHYPIVDAEGNQIGEVTSGSFSPTLGKGIALAYLPLSHTAIGTSVQVVIRNQPHPATVVKTPFYKRSK